MRLSRYILPIVLLIGLVIALMTCTSSREPEPVSSSAFQKCGNWIPALAIDESVRQTFDSDDWFALEAGLPMAAILRLDSVPSPGDPRYALWLRSGVELNEILLQLRLTQQVALRQLLERFLSERSRELGSGQMIPERRSAEIRGRAARITGLAEPPAASHSDVQGLGTVPTSHASSNASGNEEPRLQAPEGPRDLRQEPAFRGTVGSVLVVSDVLPLLRAMLAVQAGEETPVSIWLQLLSPGSSLQPAARILAAAQQSLQQRYLALGLKGSGQQRTSVAARHWLEILPLLTRSLEGIAPPDGRITITAINRIRSDYLVRWASQLRRLSDTAPASGMGRAMPAIIGLPSQWYKELRLGEPDIESVDYLPARPGTGNAFIATRLDTSPSIVASFTTKLFDATIATVLPELWRDTLLTLSLAGSAPGTQSDDGAVFVRALRNDLLVDSEPAAAAAEACGIAGDMAQLTLPLPTSLLPWLAFGDWLSLSDWSEHLNARCHRVSNQCLDSMTSFRQRHSVLEEAAAGCYGALNRVSSAAGQLVQQDAWLSGSQRRKLLTPILSDLCPEQSLHLLLEWDAIRADHPGSRWNSIPPMLLKSRRFLSQGTPIEAVHDVRELALQDPLFEGLYQTLLSLSASGQSGIAIQ